MHHRNFGISFTGNFFPIQLIYAGKTAQSLPCFKFPSEFSLSVNATHYSTSDESIKFIEEIIAPCMKKERERQHLSPTEKGLIIISVFKGQMTSDVNESLTKTYFCVVNIPANKTRFYQPLDVTVNGFCKKFLKKKFTNWYAGQQPKQLAKGIKLDEANVKLLLSTLKPLHNLQQHLFRSKTYIFSGCEVDIILNIWAKVLVFYELNLAWL